MMTWHCKLFIGTMLYLGPITPFLTDNDLSTTLKDNSNNCYKTNAGRWQYKCIIHITHTPVHI